MWIKLEHEHGFSVMAEEGISIVIGGVCASGMPALPIKYENAARRGFRLEDVGDGQVSACFRSADLGEDARGM